MKGVFKKHPAADPLVARGVWHVYVYTSKIDMHPAGTYNLGAPGLVEYLTCTFVWQRFSYEHRVLCEHLTE